MTAPVSSAQTGEEHVVPVSAGERAALLAEVDFKWLMAGQGWWVDTTRFHVDPLYAAMFLRSALASHCAALRDCAACLQALATGDIVSAE